MAVVQRWSLPPRVTSCHSTLVGQLVSCVFPWLFYLSWPTLGLFVAGAAVGVWISGGISGGHINPVVRYFSQLLFIARATSLCRPCSFVSGRILAGDNLCGAVPEIPMEESTSVHSWPTHGRILWKPVCLCQLLPRDRPVRGWERCSHSSRHCVTIRLICCKFEEELVKLILMNAFNCPI